MKYYSALVKTEILAHATTWMVLEDMLSEISCLKKKYCMSPFV